MHVHRYPCQRQRRLREVLHPRVAVDVPPGRHSRSSVGGRSRVSATDPWEDAGAGSLFTCAPWSSVLPVGGAGRPVPSTTSLHPGSEGSTRCGDGTRQVSSVPRRDIGTPSRSPRGRRLREWTRLGRVAGPVLPSVPRVGDRTPVPTGTSESPVPLVTDPPSCSVPGRRLSPERERSVDWAPGVRHRDPRSTRPRWTFVPTTP